MSHMRNGTKNHGDGSMIDNRLFKRLIYQHVKTGRQQYTLHRLMPFSLSQNRPSD